MLSTVPGSELPSAQKTLAYWSESSRDSARGWSTRPDMGYGEDRLILEVHSNRMSSNRHEL